MKRVIKNFAQNKINSSKMMTPLISLLFISIAFNICGVPSLVVILTSLITLIIVISVIPFFARSELHYRNLMSDNFVIAGRGLSTGKIRLIIEIAKIIFVVLIANTVLAVVFMRSSLSMTISLINLASLIGLVAVLLIPLILIRAWISQRKTDAEIEIPYVLVLLRVLSTLRIPLYEMLNILETSASLNTFPRELKLARKISSITSKSFITSLQEIMARHPSTLFRDLMTRIFASVTSIGDVKEIIDGIFNTVFKWYESRILSLTERLTLIMGTAIFVYFFIPLTLASTIPIYMGSSAYIAFIPAVSIQLITFLAFYALISIAYPSSLIVKPSRTLLYGGILAISLNSALLIVQTILVVNGIIVFRYNHIIIIQLVTFIPFAILAEKYLSRRNLYDRFIEIASDAMNFTANSGISLVSALIEIAKKHGKKILSFSKIFVSSYVNEELRTIFVRKAPTLYHASFIESMMIMIEHGWTSDSIKGLTSYYEKLRPLIDRLKGFSATLEYVLISLAGLMGGFLEYVKDMYMRISELYVGTLGYTYYPILLTVDPSLFLALDYIVLISFIMISMLIGKTRGGAVIYMFRSAILMTIIYALSKIVAYFALSQ